MINENLTYKKFGYYSTDLKSKSGKKIIVNCDECIKVRIIKKCDCRKLCQSCSKKRNRHPNFKNGNYFLK